ncbi:hypothetical protein A6B44_04095 [Pasteurella skyensis]|nr:hypothetical protein A6B44_04095 [Pasteurella skyensis]
MPLEIRKNVIEYCYFEAGTARFMHSVKFDNLKNNQMISGLKLFKEEYNKLIEIYSNENK